MQARKDTLKADGFINLTLIDKNGVSHTFKTGIPLHADRKIDLHVLNTPDLFDHLSPEQIKLSVHVIQEAADPTF